MSRYDYTYYTCLINNHDSKHTSSTIEPALQFNEDRNYPIITNTADYDMTITILNSTQKHFRPLFQ